VSEQRGRAGEMLGREGALAGDLYAALNDNHHDLPPSRLIVRRLSFVPLRPCLSLSLFIIIRHVLNDF